MEIFEIGRLGADSFCGVIISSSYCGVKGLIEEYVCNNNVR